MRVSSSQEDAWTNASVDNLSSEDLLRVVESVADFNAYYSFNVTPVAKLLDMLTDSFDPRRPHEQFNLDLSGRSKKAASSHSQFSSYLPSFQGYSSRYLGSGSCLSHDHETQFAFVQQSLNLWKEIMTYLPKIWFYADYDMLHESYRLVDTGQGYQRLQSCPNVGREMHAILRRVQSRYPRWVGLSVIHLGDRDVPNGTCVCHAVCPSICCIAVTDRVLCIVCSADVHR